MSDMVTVGFGQLRPDKHELRLKDIDSIRSHLRRHLKASLACLQLFGYQKVKNFFTNAETRNMPRLGTFLEHPRNRRSAQGYDFHMRKRQKRVFLDHVFN